MTAKLPRRGSLGSILTSHWADVVLGSIMWEQCGEDKAACFAGPCVKCLHGYHVLGDAPTLCPLGDVRTHYFITLRALAACVSVSSTGMLPGTVFMGVLSPFNNNNVNLSCTYQRPERTHDTY